MRRNYVAVMLGLALTVSSISAFASEGTTEAGTEVTTEAATEAASETETTEAATEAASETEADEDTTENEDTLWVHLYAGGTVEKEVNGQKAQVVITSAPVQRRRTVSRASAKSV